MSIQQPTIHKEATLHELIISTPVTFDVKTREGRKAIGYREYKYKFLCDALGIPRHLPDCESLTHVQLCYLAAAAGVSRINLGLLQDADRKAKLNNTTTNNKKS